MNEKYQKRTFVCWQTKFGGASGSWPFGKVIITPESISLSILVLGQYVLKKSDIVSIEFTSTISEHLFYYKISGKSNSYLCRINTNGVNLPKWFAFYIPEEDKKILDQYQYSISRN